MFHGFGEQIAGDLQSSPLRSKRPYELGLLPFGYREDPSLHHEKPSQNSADPVYSGLSNDQMSRAFNAKWPSQPAPDSEAEEHDLPFPLPHPHSTNIRPRRGYDKTPSPATPCKEPVSSGFNSPTSQHRPVPQPCLSSLQFGCMDGPDDDETHSTHGVPLIFPFRDNVLVDRQQSQANVTTWLDQIPNYHHLDMTDVDPAHPSPERPKCARQSRPVSPKNKENIPPALSVSYNHSPSTDTHTSSAAGSSSVPGEVIYSSTPRGFSRKGVQELHGPRHPRRHLRHRKTRSAPTVSFAAGNKFECPDTPRKIRGLPVERKRPAVAPSEILGSQKGVLQLDKMATIVDWGDEEEEAAVVEGEKESEEREAADEELAQLSPSVTLYREGRKKSARVGNWAGYGKGNLSCL